MQISDFEYEMIIHSMDAFDNMSPAWRALLREYNDFPFDGETETDYLNRMSRMNSAASLIKD